MKKIIILSIALIAIFMFISCDEDNGIYQTGPKILPIQLINSSQDTTFFSYSGNNLIEVYSSNEYYSYKDTFEYNDQNQITRSNFYYNNELDSYILYEYENNKVIKAIFYEDSYWKNNDKTYNIIENRHELGLLSNQKKRTNKAEIELAYWESYEYDNHGEIIKTTTVFPDSDIKYYSTLEYDAKGNVIKQNWYSITSESEGLYSEVINEFGDAFHYLKNLNLPPNYRIFFYNNNIISSTFNYYEDGVLYETYITDYTYHSFNEFNYPTSVTIAYDEDFQYTFSEIIYNIN